MLNMFNKNYPSLLLSLLLCPVVISCSSSTKDPATVGKGDLNPPGDVVTVTRDSKIELRWSAGNAEDDFKGYYVFALTKADYDAKAKGKAAYPKGAANPETAGIPRCKDNTKFFEAFGLPASDSDCEGGDTSSSTSAASTSSSGAKTSLTADSTASTDTTAEKLTGWSKCDEKPTSTPSLPGTSPVVTTQVCTISKLGDAKTALVNGTTYAFFVVAVSGDDFSGISWTSKVIFDTPSKEALAETSLAFAAVSCNTSSMYKISLEPTTGVATLGTAESCDGSGSNNPCSKISEPNGLTAGNYLYISRSGTGSYLQRLYISAPKGGSVVIQPRGPQTWDPILAKKTNRIPGDQAASAFDSSESGTKYVVYNNQVFDFQLTSGTTMYYGKVVIGDVTYTGGTLDAKFGDATASVKVSVVMQPGAGIKQYFE